MDCCHEKNIGKLIEDIKQEIERLSIFESGMVSAMKIEVTSKPDDDGRYLQAVYELGKSDNSQEYTWNRVLNDEELSRDRIPWQKITSLSQVNNKKNKKENKKGIYIIINCQSITHGACILEPSIVYIGGGQEKGKQSLFERVKKILQILAGKGADHPFAEKLIDVFTTFYRDQEKRFSFVIILLPLRNNYNEYVEKVEGCFHYIYSHTHPKCPYFVFVDKEPQPDFSIFNTTEKEPEQIIKSILSKIEETLRRCQNES